LKYIIDQLDKYFIISEQAKKELTGLLIRKNLKKGTLLLKEGDICQHLYYLSEGFARGFFYQNGKDITAWFAFENDIATPLYSFVSKKPSYESIEILEDSVLYTISYENLQYLYHQYPESNFIGRIITEKYYVELMARTMAFQFQSATERYIQLLNHQPQLLQRASLGQIASYLGISQETLSRIRTKK
jgi:CRP/FNR family transcriptional regulator, anaerobic regulatory protein